MQIKRLNKENYLAWNDFVDNSTQGTIFAKSWYLDALQVKYDVLTIQENNKIVAGIVLARNEINTFSNPMMDKFLGVLFSYEHKNTQEVISKQYKILNLLIRELKKHKSFDYYFHPTFTNWIPFYWNGFTQQTRYTYIIDLSLSLESIKCKYHNKLKNHIKNALNKNIEIKKDIPFDLFYSIIDKTFKRQGSKAPFSKIKLNHFVDELTKMDKFISFGAYNNKNQLIAVCGLVYDKKSSYLLFNGIDIDNHVRGANALMIDKSIEYFHEKCNYFDFEGSMLNGVEQFYRRFGGELTSYMRIWNDNFLNYTKSKVKNLYKIFLYGR